MTQLAVTGSPAKDGGASRLIPLLWPILAALLVLRGVLAAHVQLVPDEAFYWTWTRHLAPGYFDHPAMIAVLMWLSTRVLGNTEFGVRLPAIVLSLASIGVIVSLARRLLRDDRAAGYVAMIWLVSPLLAVMGLIFTPDTPAIFFSVCALSCAALIAQRSDESDPADSHSSRGTAALWLLFGLFCGLAMDSKYTTVLVPAGVGLAMLTSRRGLAHFRGPWIYVSALIALLVFSPVIYWNATHHWASFAFQLHHGAGEGITEGATGFLEKLGLRLMGLAEFAGGQALVWTPILFAVALVVMARAWRRYRQLADVDRVLLWTGTLPLVFFGWAATRSHGEINWPAFAYFPLSLLIARYLSEHWSGNRVHWTREGCKLALAMMIGLHIIAWPAVSGLLVRWHVPLPHSVTDLTGWREFGQQLSQRADGAPVVCNRHQDADEAAFYMPGQPDVWCEGVGSRPTAFDYFDKGRPDYSKIDRLLFVGGHVPQFMEKSHYTRAMPLPVIKMPGGKKGKTRRVEVVAR